MSDILTTLPQFAALIEKAGIIGVLLIVTAVLAWYCMQLRKELSTVYRQRDRWRLGFAILKTACDQAGLKPDLAQLADLTETA